MTQDISIHVTGIAGFALMAIGYALKDDTRLRWTSLSALVVFLAHMTLLSAWATVLTMVLALSMLLCGYLGARRTSIALFAAGLAFLPAGLMAMTLGLAVWTDLVPVLAGIFINGGLLFFRGERLTLCLATGEGLATLNAVLIGTPYGAAANFLALAALGIRSLRRLADRVHQGAAT